MRLGFVMSSLIIQPSAVDQGKIFYALHVQSYLKLGVPRGHIEPVLVAAACLRGAWEQGCEEIEVGLEGMLPRRYSVQSVWEQICRDPAKFRGWYRPPPINRAQQVRERLIQRFLMPSSTTWAR